MAKMILMFETEKDKIPAPPSEEAWEHDLEKLKARKHLYDFAYLLLEQPNDGDEGSMHVPKRDFKEVLKELELLPAVETMISLPFVLDYHHRPTAEALLSSKEFRKLCKLGALHALNVPEEDPSKEDPLGDNLHGPLLA